MVKQVLAAAAGAATRVNPPDDPRPGSPKKPRSISFSSRVLPKIPAGAGSANSSASSSANSSAPATLTRKRTLSIVRTDLTLRKRIGLLLEAPKSSHAAMALMILMISVIALSTLNFFLASDPNFNSSQTIKTIESVCSVFFSVELCFRTFVASQNPKQLMLQDWTYWVDVLSIVPYYVELAVKSGNGPTALLPTWLRTLQLLRLLRIIKLFRHCT